MNYWKQDTVADGNPTGSSEAGLKDTGQNYFCVCLNT